MDLRRHPYHKAVVGHGTLAAQREGVQERSFLEDQGLPQVADPKHGILPAGIVPRGFAHRQLGDELSLLPVRPDFLSDEVEGKSPDQQVQLLLTHRPVGRDAVGLVGKQQGVHAVALHE
eukprot:391716_1